MYCTKCGVELPEDVRFCSSCGNRTAAAPPREMPLTLMLDKRNKKIAGVCAGFARYVGVDVVLVRVLMLGFAICTGVGFFVYLAAWMIMPSDYCLETRDVAARIPQPG
jgi:phage shock protein C